MHPLNDAEIIVVKIGSSLISDVENFAPRTPWLHALAEDIASLAKQGKKLVVVSSGAVAFGRPVLELGARALTLPEKQAASAAGQPLLIAAWQAALMPHAIHVAQILMTLTDSEERRRYLNARTTFEHLLGANIIPIVNENDTVATAELRYGDNDRLAARVAAMIGADTLVLLSDVDGLYTKPPAQAGAKHLAEVAAITPEIEAMAGGAASATSSGGMITKLAAAKIATSAGCQTLLASGQGMHPLRSLIEGGKHTRFKASHTPLQARKQWIAGALHVPGALVVDAGAADALREGKSLLPAGVRSIKGFFERGDTVSILDLQGAEIGKGIVGYDAEDAQKIIGRKTHEIAAILGYALRDTLIHRDDMVVE
jgi:glutamate 5-kinase